MNLSLEEKKLITESFDHNCINVCLKGKNYYVKQNQCDFFIKEKYGEVIAKKLGFICPHYDVINVCDNSLIICEDLNNYGKFTLASDIVRKSVDKNIVLERDFEKNRTFMSLSEIWAYLEDNKMDAKTIMKEVVKLYLMDILTLNSDRTFNNWGIIESKDKINLGVFDHTEMMFVDDLVMHSYADDDDYERNLKLKNEIELSSIEKIFIDLENFVTVSSDEFVSDLENIIEELNPTFLYLKMREIEIKYNQKFHSDNFWLMSNFMHDRITNILKKHNYCRKKTNVCVKQNK